jgi:hypothetical protein
MLLLDIDSTRLTRGVLIVERTNWICPGCDVTYAVPNTDGLTLCPTCQKKPSVPPQISKQQPTVDDWIDSNSAILAKMCGFAGKCLAAVGLASICAGSPAACITGLLSGLISAAFAQSAEKSSGNAARQHVKMSMCVGVIGLALNVGFLGYARSVNAAADRAETITRLKNAHVERDLDEKFRIEQKAISDRTPSIGEDVVLRSATSEQVMLSPTSEDWSEAAKRAARKDQLGFAQLINEGRLIVAENETTGRMMRGGFEAYEVRVTNGRHMGKSGWILKEDVHKVK